jgi:hypothetical protein
MKGQLAEERLSCGRVSSCIVERVSQTLGHVLRFGFVVFRALLIHGLGQTYLKYLGLLFVQSHLINDYFKKNLLLFFFLYIIMLNSPKTLQPIAWTS